MKAMTSDLNVSRQRNRQRNKDLAINKEQRQHNTKTKTSKPRQNNNKRPHARNSTNTGANGAQGSNEQTSSRSDSPSSFDNLPSSSAGLDGFDELNSNKKGNKRGNLDHLLNFEVTPHFSRALWNHGYGSKNYKHPYQGSKPIYKKEQYLQANFQFVVQCKGKPQINGSPDALIDWNFIEQINLRTTDEPKCPICLYPPIAAKLTRCGHAYCWTCMLHYLSLSDKEWRQCPICHDVVHKEDLKSCTVQQQLPIKVGSEVTLQLMRRRKDSIFIETCDQKACVLERFPLMCADDELKRYSKFLIARRIDVAGIIDREQDELGTKMTLDDFEPIEQFFVEKALSELKDRREKLRAVVESKGTSESSDLSEFSACTGNKNEEMLESRSIKSESETATASASASSSNNVKYFYFYQSDDGQLIYLHSLNVKMLQHCNGSLEYAPKAIKGRVLQLEQLSMNENYRQKFTCLSHLPLTCQFTIVEIELKPPYVTMETVTTFKGEINNRSQERRNRQKEEIQREKKIDLHNDRQMGKIIASTANLDLNSALEFPACGDEKTTSNPALLASSLEANVSSYSNVAEFGERPSNFNDEFSIPLGARQKRQSKNKSRGHNMPLQSLMVQPSGDATNDTPGGSLNFGKLLSGVVAENHQNSEGDIGKKQKRGKKMTRIFSTGLNFKPN